MADSARPAESLNLVAATGRAKTHNLLRGLEIQTGIDRKRSSAGDVVPLVRARRAGAGDVSEAGGVDIGYGIGPVRSVQHIHRVNSKLEFFPFSNSDALDEIQIQSDMGRPLYPAQAEGAELSGSGIYKNRIALCICNRELAELILESLCSSDGCFCGVWTSRRRFSIAIWWWVSSSSTSLKKCHSAMRASAASAD